MADESTARDRPAVREEPVLFVGRAPGEHGVVATGSEGQPAQARHRYLLMVASTAGWPVAIGLVLWFRVLRRPSVGEVVAVLGLEAAVFAFVVVGDPIVALAGHILAALQLRWPAPSCSSNSTLTPTPNATCCSGWCPSCSQSTSQPVPSCGSGSPSQMLRRPVVTPAARDVSFEW